MHFPTSWRARACFRGSIVQPAIVAASLLASLTCGTVALAGDTYSLTDIGIANIKGISSNGVVIVGYNSAGGLTHAFSYDGTLHDLDTLGVRQSSAVAVSANGAVIVGTAQTTGLALVAFSYYDGVMHDLGPIGYPTGVSADGTVIVGYSYDGSNSHAFSYAGTLTDLGSFGGGASYANGVSADGKVVVGAAEISHGFYHAFRYSNGVMVDLGALGDSTTVESTANAISADGVVTVGSSTQARLIPLPRTRLALPLCGRAQPSPIWAP